MTDAKTHRKVVRAALQRLRGMARDVRGRRPDVARAIGGLCARLETGSYDTCRAAKDAALAGVAGDAADPAWRAAHAFITLANQEASARRVDPYRHHHDEGHHGDDPDLEGE